MTKIFARAVLSHGTVETKDLIKTRRFYEKFLGLDVVQPSPLAIYASAGGSWKLSCVRTGRKLKEQGRENRFSLFVPSADMVRQAHNLAMEQQADFAIRTIDGLVEDHDQCSFLLQDCNHTWWEVVNRPSSPRALEAAILETVSSALSGA